MALSRDLVRTSRAVNTYIRLVGLKRPTQIVNHTSWLWCTKLTRNRILMRSCDGVIKQRILKLEFIDSNNGVSHYTSKEKRGSCHSWWCLMPVFECSGNSHLARASEELVENSLWRGGLLCSEERRWSRRTTRHDSSFHDLKERVAAIIFLLVGRKWFCRTLWMLHEEEVLKCMAMILI